MYVPLEFPIKLMVQLSQDGPLYILRGHSLQLKYIYTIYMFYIKYI